MGVTRKVKFEYYELVCKEENDSPNLPDRLFDLQRWIDKASKLSLEDRTFDYYAEGARLEKFVYNDAYDCWFLNFVRARVTNIPLRGRVNSEAEPIELDDDEFIGEDVSMLYDPKLNVAMLQKNIYSLSPGGIEKYLNLLWGVDNEQIYLRPIYDYNTFNKALKAKIYKKFVVRFAQLPKEDIGLNSSLKNIIANFGEYNGVSGEVIINIWPARQGSLSKETVHETLKDIKMYGKDVFKKAQVSVKDCEDDRVEIIDLFDEKLCDYLTFSLEARRSLECEYVQQEMARKYFERRPEILNLVKRDD